MIEDSHIILILKNIVLTVGVILHATSSYLRLVIDPVGYGTTDEITHNQADKITDMNRANGLGAFKT